MKTADYRHGFIDGFTHAMTKMAYLITDAARRGHIAGEVYGLINEESRFATAEEITNELFSEASKSVERYLEETTPSGADTARQANSSSDAPTSED